MQLLSTLAMSSNLRKQAPLYMEFHLLQGTLQQCIVFIWCKLNCYFFVNFNTDRFINNGKTQPSNTCICIFIFLVHHITMLYNSCFAVCNFLHSFIVCTSVTTQHQPNPVCKRAEGAGVTFSGGLPSSHQCKRPHQPLKMSRGTKKAKYKINTLRH